MYEMSTLHVIHEVKQRTIHHSVCDLKTKSSISDFCNTCNVGGGRNVDDQNVDRPKISERRNGLFS
jgi:hypothetical protein